MAASSPVVLLLSQSGNNLSLRFSSLASADVVVAWGFLASREVENDGGANFSLLDRRCRLLHRQAQETDSLQSAWLSSGFKGTSTSSGAILPKSPCKSKYAIFQLCFSVYHLASPDMANRLDRLRLLRSSLRRTGMTKTSSEVQSCSPVPHSTTILFLMDSRYTILWFKVLGVQISRIHLVV